MLGVCEIDLVDNYIVYHDGSKKRFADDFSEKKKEKVLKKHRASMDVIEECTMIEFDVYPICLRDNDEETKTFLELFGYETSRCPVDAERILREALQVKLGY